MRSIVGRRGRVCSFTGFLSPRLTVLASLACACALVCACALAGAPGASAPALAFVRVPGSPFSTGAGSSPSAVAFSPVGSLLATTNAGSVGVYSVDPITHAPAAVTGSPFADAGSPASLAFSPDGGVLATANSVSGTVSMFSVDPTTHRLSQIAGSPFSIGAGAQPVSVAFNPGGDLLATADQATGMVSVFSVHSGTHALSPVAGSPFPAGGHADSVAFSPIGGQLAAANGSDRTVSVFAVNSTTPTLAPVAGSPFAVGTDAAAVAFSPDGQALAVADGTAGSVSVFSLDLSAHALTPVAGSPYSAFIAPPDLIGFGGHQDVIAFSRTGGWLATGNTYGGGVSVFAVDPHTHVLSQAPGSPFGSPLGQDTGTPTTPGDGVAFSPSGQALAVTDTGDRFVSVFTPAKPAFCPKLGGVFRGAGLGPVKLGMTRAGVRRLFHGLYAARHRKYIDYFCLMRVAYPSPKLLGSLTPSQRKRVRGRSVMELSSNRTWSLHGVHPGAKLAAAAANLHTGRAFHVGPNYWYLAAFGSSRAVLEVSHGIVQEIGIADKQLTRNRSLARALLSSFS